MNTQQTAGMPDARPDFRHVRTWIFDLDHTLYTTDAAQHRAMEERICVYVQGHLGLARDPAWEIQKRYLRDHGSTVAGLVRHHGVDPDAYHDAINDLDALGLTGDAPLRAALLRLSGQRLVFTNNCGRFAGRVLEKLGVADLFAGIVDVKALNYVPKPNLSAYDTLIASGGFDAKSAALFDDSVRNLIPARARGMTTVWFNNGGGQSQWRSADQQLHIDHETDNLLSFLQSLRV
ncbi:MAG TPA: pyrimidine 5'-nucleotidase [Rhizomicrobium sp.]